MNDDRSDTSMSMFGKEMSRREVMKTGMKGAAYAAPVLLASALPAGALAQSAVSGTAARVKAIFTVARTAEQLAVTFYSNGVANAAVLGLTAVQKAQLQAALVEEQLHQLLFTAQGGDSLADTFSFPQGAKTFTDLQTFIATQQQLEGVFDSAFLAAVRELPRRANHDWHRSLHRLPVSSRSTGFWGERLSGLNRRTTGHMRQYS